MSENLPTETDRAVNLSLRTVLFQQGFLAFKGCVNARKDIFNTLLTMLWQRMQLFTDESH